MSAQSQGPGWWVASDGKWYPPESHPDFRPPPPPPPSAPPPPTGRRSERAPAHDRPPRQRREKRGTPLWKLALGVCLGILLFFVVCSAIVGGAAKKVSDDAAKPATVRIEAADGVCWTATLTGTEGGSLGQNQQEGCGAASFELPSGLGANAVVSKRTQGGELTAVVEVDGEETDRQSTNADFGIVTVGR